MKYIKSREKQSFARFPNHPRKVFFRSLMVQQKSLGDYRVTLAVTNYSNP
ncbi:uncharacterized protein J3R85_010014 [Psidium guajava]|nr:uncharacterized protein J3R85_010014 [Psidium guajava]